MQKNFTLSVLNIIQPRLIINMLISQLLYVAGLFFAQKRGNLGG